MPNGDDLDGGACIVLGTLGPGVDPPARRPRRPAGGNWGRRLNLDGARLVAERQVILEEPDDGVRAIGALVRNCEFVIEGAQAFGMNTALRMALRPVNGHESFAGGGIQ